eukprot:scpid48149/ scgid21569/ 
MVEPTWHGAHGVRHFSARAHVIIIARNRKSREKSSQLAADPASGSPKIRCSTTPWQIPFCNFCSVVSHSLKETMSLALRCARALRPAGIQLRSLSLMDIHQGTGDRQGQLIRAQVKNHEGYVYVDIRRYWVPEDSAADDFQPTKKGISLNVDQFANLAAAIPQIREMIKEES